MKVYLATTMREIGQTLTLTKMGERERLLSYFDTRAYHASIKQYIKTGIYEGLSIIYSPRK